MHDFVNLVEVVESRDDGEGNLGKNRFRDGTDFLIDVVERALVHEFHAHGDVRILEVGAVKSDDPRRVAIAHDLQLADDLLSSDLRRGDMDNLVRRTKGAERKSQNSDHVRRNRGC